MSKKQFLLIIYEFWEKILQKFPVKLQGNTQ